MTEQSMELAGYDFIDFGASEGGSIRFAKQALGGVRGIGIDIDPKKVATMREKGYDCLEGDITQLELPANSVRFVMMSHILEHLPGLDAVEAVLRSAVHLATDFIYIQGPFFDADPYLKELGFKLYWSDWHGHPCHLETTDLIPLFKETGVSDYRFLLNDVIRDSSDSCVHPLASPTDQHAYDPDKHPVKPTVPFTQPVYREMICLALMRPLSNVAQLLRARKRAVPMEKAMAKSG